MNCQEACKLADDCVFGLLEPETEKAVLSHAKECETCAGALQEAKSRRELLDSWKAQTNEGSSDRLMARIGHENLRVRASYGHRLVRIMAAAAVILAAVVLPRLLLEESTVLPFETRMTSVEGSFRESVRQEFNVPRGEGKHSYIVVRLRSVDKESPVRAGIYVNDFLDDPVLSSASQIEEVYILGMEHGIRTGKNLLFIRNLGSVPLEFEVSLITGETK